MNKILHIITRLDQGGSAQNTLLTCLGLNRKYDFVLVHGLSHESEMTDLEQKRVDMQVREARENGVKVIAVPFLVRRINPVFDFVAFLFLLRLMIRERPSIVHTHTSKAGVLGRLAAKIAGVPLTVHTPHGHVFYGHFSPMVSRVFLVIERIMAHITDCTVALTEGEKKDYIKFAVSDAESTVTIHSGVDIELFRDAKGDIEAIKRTLALGPKELVVGTVGWLIPVKGPMHLLRAMGRVWRAYPDTRLVFVGKGELEGALKKEALEMGISDRVLFLGWRDDIPEVMHLIDIFVLPSLNEGMGRVLVEAMAVGRPVVASNVGGIPGLVSQGENGLLVPPGDIEALAKGIESLLSDAAKRKQFGEHGKKKADKYSLDSMLAKIDFLYSRLLMRKQSPGEGP